MPEHKYPRAGVGVLVINEENKILLGRRHEDPEKADSLLHGAGQWTMPGGKLDWQLTPLAGAKKELTEETGLIAKKMELVSVTNDAVEDNHFITIGFKCTEYEGRPKVMEPDEITEWQWFNTDEVPENMYGSSKKLLDNYLNKRLYSDE